MKYTFVTCTYNRDKYLGKTLESVCQQTFPKSDYEVLVVNNNSTDTTPEIFASYSKQYQDVQMRCILETQQGLSFALNRGIKEAKGEFLIYVDDDETVDENHLEKLDCYLTKYPFIELIGTKVEPIYEVEKPKWMSYFTLRLMTGFFDKGDKVRSLTAKDYPGTGHTIIKKSLYDKFGTFNTELGRRGGSLMGAEDKDMCMRLIENNVKCHYLPSLVIYHHIPQRKLTSDFFHTLTFSIGKSERIRTLGISQKAYYYRLFSEAIKWGVSIILSVGYTLVLAPHKGWKLIQFRWNVTRGLFTNDNR